MQTEPKLQIRQELHSLITAIITGLSAVGIPSPSNASGSSTLSPVAWRPKRILPNVRVLVLWVWAWNDSPCTMVWGPWVYPSQLLLQPNIVTDMCLTLDHTPDQTLKLKSRNMSTLTLHFLNFWIRHFTCCLRWKFGWEMPDGDWKIYVKK
jgi:hypothetical protein